MLRGRALSKTYILTSSHYAILSRIQSLQRMRVVDTFVSQLDHGRCLALLWCIRLLLREADLSLRRDAARCTRSQGNHCFIFVGNMCLKNLVAPAHEKASARSAQQTTAAVPSSLVGIMQQSKNKRLPSSTSVWVTQGPELQPQCNGCRSCRAAASNENVQHNVTLVR